MPSRAGLCPWAVVWRPPALQWTANRKTTEDNRRKKTVGKAIAVSKELKKNFDWGRLLWFSLTFWKMTGNDWKHRKAPMSSTTGNRRVEENASELHQNSRRIKALLAQVIPEKSGFALPPTFKTAQSKLQPIRPFASMPSVWLTQYVSLNWSLAY